MNFANIGKIDPIFTLFGLLMFFRGITKLTIRMTPYLSQKFSKGGGAFLSGIPLIFYDISKTHSQFYCRIKLNREKHVFFEQKYMIFKFEQNLKNMFFSNKNSFLLVDISKIQPCVRQNFKKFRINLTLCLCPPSIRINLWCPHCEYFRIFVV